MGTYKVILKSDCGFNRECEIMDQIRALGGGNVELLISQNAYQFTTSDPNVVTEIKSMSDVSEVREVTNDTDDPSNFTPSG